jgi:hypothetical protein
MTWTVGQAVVVVTRDPYSKREAVFRDGVVTKVGRKWVTVAIDRFEQMYDATTGYQKTEYMARHQLYPDLESYLTQVRRDRLCSLLVTRVQGYGNPLRDISEANLRAACILLGIDISEVV